MINFPIWAIRQTCSNVVYNTEPTIKTFIKSSICSGQPPSNMADILNQLVKSDPEIVVCNSLDETDHSSSWFPGLSRLGNNNLVPENPEILGCNYLDEVSINHLLLVTKILRTLAIFVCSSNDQFDLMLHRPDSPAHTGRWSVTFSMLSFLSLTRLTSNSAGVATNEVYNKEQPATAVQFLSQTHQATAVQFFSQWSLNRYFQSILCFKQGMNNLF